ncbi:MAG: serpin family protein [Symploca sp. SIO2E6]|nr:serpin family protein [Symploca sp. SIO2E6]
MNRQMLSRVSAIVAASVVIAGFLGAFMTHRINAIDPSPNPPSPKDAPIAAQPPNPPVDEKFVAANTKFGFKLFSEILKQQQDENIFISPTSVAIALAMTYNGASGETQQAMADVLELQQLSLKDINQAHHLLQTSLTTADPQVQLSIANSLWVKQGVPFKGEFLQTNQQFYSGKVTELDFASPEAPKVINSWVKENTNGKIEQIVEQLQPDHLLFLINAIYFKGNWSEQFDKSKTTERPFYLTDGTTKQHPMMSQFGNYRYTENDSFQAISLPYGGGRLSLYVFLPREDTTLETFQQQLTYENWQQWMNQFQMRDGEIQLPRFQFDYDIQLNDALKALGMEAAFTASQADFSNMTAAPVKIDEIKHKTFVEVNEEGTEAAAATSVGVAITSVTIPKSPFQMVVERPFFVAIRDNQTRTVLFMGSVVEPQ